MQNTLTQGYAFLAYLYAGMLLCILYDLFFSLRHLFNRRCFTHLCDILFVLLFFIILYTVIGLADDGMIRAYGLFTAAGGAVLAQWSFGCFICKSIVKRRV